jgi:hypothetical protein
MSSIEERLARDIAEVTKGVIVTEPELLEARSALDERIDGTRRRDRRRTVVAIAAATVVVAGAGASLVAVQAFDGDTETAAVAGPSPTTAEDPYAYWFTGALPTPKAIDGFWREDNGSISMWLSEDGTVQIDDQGSVYSQPGAWGTYEIDGDTINMTFTGGAACEGTQQTMRASLMRDGTMRAIAEVGVGAGCTPLPAYQIVWEHMLPAAGEWNGFSEEAGYQPLPGSVPLNGDWAAEGGGWVLEMTPNGKYYVLDDSADAVDQGEWSRQGSDLVLTSSARSTECSNGDRFVLGNVQWVNVGTDVIKGTVEENSCNGAWTPKAWFLIPNEGI